MRKKKSVELSGVSSALFLCRSRTLVKAHTCLFKQWRGPGMLWDYSQKVRDFLGCNFRARLKTMTLIHCTYSIYCITCHSNEAIHHGNHKEIHWQLAFEPSSPLRCSHFHTMRARRHPMKRTCAVYEASTASVTKINAPNKRPLLVWSNLWEQLRTHLDNLGTRGRAALANEAVASAPSFQLKTAFAKQLWLQSDWTICLGGNPKCLSVPTEAQHKTSTISD